MGLGDDRADWSSVSGGITDLSMTDATAVITRCPMRCPVVGEAFAGLVGLDVARGFDREVQPGLGEPRGSTELEHIARFLRPDDPGVTSPRARSMTRPE